MTDSSAALRSFKWAPLQSPDSSVQMMRNRRVSNRPPVRGLFCLRKRVVLLATIDPISRFTGDGEVRLDNLAILVYSMPAANRGMPETNSRDLFPGALEMMILESLRRQPAHGCALVQYIQGISMILNLGKSPA
jgi:hypothetical protein